MAEHRSCKRGFPHKFGSVLYEMVTGRRAFQRSSKLSTMSAVLREEPNPPSQVSPDVPHDLEKLILRCLRKDPDSRWQAAADLRVALRELQEESDSQQSGLTAAARKGNRRWLVAALSAGLAMGCVLLGALLAWLAIRPAGLNQAKVPQLVSVARLTHDPEFSESPTWSPDGSLLAFASNRSGNFEIYVRRVGGGQEVNVTNDPGQDIQPAFSPDGNWIAFVSTRPARSGGGSGRRRRP